MLYNLQVSFIISGVFQLLFFCFFVDFIRLPSQNCSPVTIEETSWTSWHLTSPGGPLFFCVHYSIKKQWALIEILSIFPFHFNNIARWNSGIDWFLFVSLKSRERLLHLLHYDPYARFVAFLLNQLMHVICFCNLASKTRDVRKCTSNIANHTVTAPRGSLTV